MIRTLKSGSYFFAVGYFVSSRNANDAFRAALRFGFYSVVFIRCGYLNAPPHRRVYFWLNFRFGRQVWPNRNDKLKRKLRGEYSEIENNIKNSIFKFISVCNFFAQNGCIALKGAKGSLCAFFWKIISLFISEFGQTPLFKRILPCKRYRQSTARGLSMPWQTISL